MTYLNKEKLTEELNKTPMIAQHIDCMDLFDAINNSIAENVAEVVRCKDCKHRPKQTNPPDTCGFSIEFPEEGKCPCQCVDDGYYSWFPSDDWFCADGEAVSK